MVRRQLGSVPGDVAARAETLGLCVHERSFSTTQWVRVDWLARQ
jgi:hypothetical protein